jgi:AAA15 family ATPase/GTPase
VFTVDLQAVSVKRLRSVSEAAITNCGRFNVLIGKNNAGKSTMLSALQTITTVRLTTSLLAATDRWN